jgi:osmoprotectant transport system permease protein
MRRGEPLDFIDYIRDHPEQFRELLIQHVQLVGFSVLIAILIAIPLAVLTSRVAWLERPMSWLANIGQTVPSLAVLGLTLPLLGIGFRPALFALTIKAILPIFLNTFIGIRSVDRTIADAARGMGTSDRQLLWLVELPLASPVMFAGIQTAAVQNISLATLAAYIGGGGFGDWILQGLAIVNPPILFAGAVPVAVLAMGTEIGMRGLRRVIVPTGLAVR